MKMVLVVDGESANSLFAAGPNDIRDYFAPKEWGIASGDIVRCTFEEITDTDGNIIPMSDAVMGGKPYRVCTHEDNFRREKD